MTFANFGLRLIRGECIEIIIEEMAVDEFPSSPSYEGECIEIDGKNWGLRSLKCLPSYEGSV